MKPFKFWGILMLLVVQFKAAAATSYVNPNSTNPVPPYASWSSAATNIQNAIDAATDGDQIFVTNGVYQTGGRVVYGSLTNRVVINKAVTVRSVNGPSVTTILGNPIIGDNAVRCVYLTNNAALIGFTLIQGATRDVQGDSILEWLGGGAWCESTNSLISNCVFIASLAANGGSAVYGGTLNSCFLANNMTTDSYLDGYGGAAANSILNNCQLVNNSSMSSGGGADSCTLNACILAGNVVIDGQSGGGAARSTLNNCIITNNVADYTGGGAFASTLNNCTILNNYSQYAGGVIQSTLNNCISYYNQDSVGYDLNYYASSLNACCVYPDAGGNNFTNVPNFVNLANGNVHLQSPSFCINSGDNSTVVTSTDFDGNPRIVGAYVDVGAYEFQSAAPVPLSITSAQVSYTNVATGFQNVFFSNIAGHSTSNTWNFGDGSIVTNQLSGYHTWTNAGTYAVIFTIYNADNPAGVSSNVTVHVFSNPIYYVAQSNTKPVSPFTSWATAATNLQDAADASIAGSTILVSNGFYQTGGRVNGNSNRVWLKTPVSMQSLNGPQVTIIRGSLVPGLANLSLAVRCVYLGPGSSLSGFTLTNGTTGSTGGGVFCGDTSGIISNCVIVGNIAAGGGGGGYGGSYYNCIISSNSTSQYGGGVYFSTLNNCLVVSNTAHFFGGGSYNSGATNCTYYSNYAVNGGGGASGGNLANSIFFNNSIGSFNTFGTNVTGAYSATRCCSFPLLSGTGNITNNPQFIDAANGNFQLTFGSLCINSGSNSFVTTALDLAGSPRIYGGTVDMGAYENQGTHVFHYVNLSNTAPVSPYTNWATAATNLQNAIDASLASDVVIVSNGIYNSGGRVVHGISTNRVVLNKALTVQSLNGPAVTTIIGNYSSAADLGIRCAYLTNGASLIGFTLTNGSSRFSGDLTNDQSGGIVWCESASAIISNCVVAAGHAQQYGGGAYQGTLNNCLIFSNTVTITGGGAYLANLNNCVVSRNRTIQGGGGGGSALGVINNCLVVSNLAGGNGGGALMSTLNGCTVTNNSAGYGGGICGGAANNCLIVSNYANFDGGGAASNTLNNCILSSNHAVMYGGGTYVSIVNNCTVVNNNSTYAAGGTYQGVVNNSIIFYNFSSSSNNYAGDTFRYCNTVPPPPGPGNFANIPGFASVTLTNLHLLSNSPCINSGNNSYFTNTTDLDGNPRIVAGTVDVGAYEFQTPTSVLSYAYAQQYNILTDGFSDYADADGDGLNNWQEWRAGTNPNNAASALRMTSTSNSLSGGVTITWQSVTNISYTLQRSTNLATQPAFSILQTAIPGQTNITTYTDTTATNTGPYFYRVSVQ